MLPRENHRFQTAENAGEKSQNQGVHRSGRSLFLGTVPGLRTHLRRHGGDERGQLGLRF